MLFVQLKALGGINYVRADQVVAVSSTEPTKCTVALAGGATVPCAEPAKDVVERLEAAVRAKQD
ncbi:MAG TPA: hypothetical protein VGY52_14720 [Roseiarcus sp.]|jgi:hypothetical protein|nr:hypothetical protein [Roseiarcus sp.]